MGEIADTSSHRAGVTAQGASLPYGILLVLVAAFPWDDALGFPTEQISVGKLLGVALVVTYLASRPHRRWVPMPNVLWILFAFTVEICVSLLHSGRVVDGAPKLLRYLMFATFVFLFVQLVTDRIRLVRLAGVFVISAAAAAAVGTFRFLASMNGRASGPIGDANDFGYMLATAVPLALYLAWRHRERRALWLLATGILFVTVACTLSRGAAVALGVAALWAALGNRALRKALAAAAVGTAVLVGALLVMNVAWVNQRLHAKIAVADENVTAREALWRGAIDMFREQPVLGVGTGLYPHRAAEFVHDEPYRIVEPVAHNAYLEVLAENGVIGFILFVVFIGGSWVVVTRARRAARRVDDVDGAQMALAIQAGTIVAVVGAMFLSVQIAAPIWLTAAMGLVLAAHIGDSVTGRLPEDRAG